MIRLILALALVACSGSEGELLIRPRAECGTSCTNSSQCDGIGRCNVCGVSGKCTNSLPASPLDAGMDAATQNLKGQGR